MIRPLERRFGQGESRLRIKVLGAAGTEVPGHNCPAFLIDGKILLDAGTIAVSLNIREEHSLKWILLTHAHLDHIKGIPFLLDNLVTRSTREYHHGLEWEGRPRRPEEEHLQRPDLA